VVEGGAKRWLVGLPNQIQKLGRELGGANNFARET